MQENTPLLEQGSTMDSNMDPETAFLQSLLHFEYRKILRRFGGSLLNPGRWGMFSVGVFILWLVNFAVYAVEISRGELTIKFDWATDVGSSISATALAGGYIQLLTLVLVLTAINWNVGSIVQYYFWVLVLTTILTFIFKFTLDSYLATAIVQYVTCCLLGIILGDFIWNFDFVPRFVRWRYGKTKLSGDRAMQNLASFPIFACARFGLYLVMVIPIWIPLAMVFAAVGILHLIFPCEYLFPLDVLFRMEPWMWELHCVEFESRPIVSQRPLWARTGSGPDIYVKAKVSYKERRFFNCLGRICPCLDRPLLFTFEGETDENFVPNGNGTWKDSDRNGEFLEGSWERGIPEAPHRSREYVAGGTFQAVQVGVIMASDGSVDQVENTPNFLLVDGSPTPVYAVGSVECCVSEQFYKGFPETNYIHGRPGGPEPEGISVDEVISRVCGGDVETVQQRDDRELEAVVFIPGFNSCLNNAMSTFAMFLTLGGYPKYLVPWLFEWPGSAVVTYYRARTDAESTNLHGYLLQFFVRLASTGIKRVNVIGHSMGARVVISFLENNAHVFRSPSTLTLGAVFLINPEADLSHFISASKEIESIAESVTIYADHADEALFWAEWANTINPIPGRSPGRFADSLGRAKEPLRRDVVRPEAEDASADMIEAPVEPGAAAKLLPPGQSDEDSTELLDIDFIDTSSIRANVASLRHSYFHVSREVIEDTRELLVSRKRASLRKSRLIRREGNVFGWLQAPSFYTV